MTETKPKIEFSLSPQSGSVPVIVVAAGSSSRMGKNKQLIEIGGMPVIVRTLRAFENCNKISRIILVTRAEDIFTLQTFSSKYNISKLSDIVCGGANRQESVLNGFQRLAEDDKKVLIHDGARPLVTDKVITDVIEALEKYSAVTCAVKLKDTVKQIDESGKVIKTLDRNSLVAVQTPQGVWKEEYLSAVDKAEDVSGFTDDMSVMESAGHSAYITEGDYKNIKITTPEDIIAAEGYLGEEE